MTHARGLTLGAVLIVTGAVGCELDRLPSAPSELTAGIVVYEHANFRGQSAAITEDIRDLRDVRGPCEHYESDGTTGGGRYIYDWNDCISSVRIAPGWRATLYRDDNYRDDSLDITDDVANLQLVPRHDCPHDGLNDCVTSIRVSPR